MFNAKREVLIIYKKIWAVLSEIVHLHELTKTSDYETDGQNQMQKHGCRYSS